MEEGQIIYFFKENGEDFNSKLANGFEEYLKESNEKVENSNEVK